MGQNVVVLHGWGRGVEKWQGFKKELEKFGFEVFLPEMPGFGQTLAPEKAWSVNDYLDWLKPQLPLKYWLVAHSFGGRIAIKLASQRPKGLEGLVLINSAGIKPRLSIKKFSFLFLAKAGRAVCLLPPFCLARGLARKALYRLAGSQDYYQAQGVMKKTLQKVTAEDLTPFLKKIKIPTLILWGGQDKETSLRDGQLMNSLISNSKLKVWSQSGHLLPLKMSKQTAREISDFMKTVS